MLRLTAYLKRRLRDRLLTALAKWPTGRLSLFLPELVQRHVASLPPADGLRFMFGLDADLYPLQGRLAVAYDGGIHTKHRHTRYHEFFTSRIHEGEQVLDVGCGNGALSKDIAESATATVLAVDLQKKNIETAREHYAHPRVTYLQGDALQELPRHKFDVVVLSNVLEHLPDRVAFLRRLLAETNAARLLLRVPLFERDWRVPLKRELGLEWRLDGTHETEYTLEAFAAEMEQAGLNMVHQEVRWGEIWAELTVTKADSLEALQAAADVFGET
jgi:SAM-dependent methyltransferase